jgi:D-cysteine desulfhydrase
MLVTSGAAQSNHARLTAAVGARLGLAVVLVLQRSPSAGSRGNLLLDSLFGADVVWTDEDDDPAAVVEAVAADRSAHGARPVVIPFGGSNQLSTNGYAECAEEIRSQGDEPDHVVVALGSGGSMAGLVRVFGADRVLGVHCGAVAHSRRVVGQLLEAANDGRDLRIRLDQVGDGYSRLTPEVADALRLAGRTEGIALDPTYTGRAMAGLIASVRDGEIKPGERTIFLHTGGLPGLFGHDESQALANESWRTATSRLG